MELLMKAKDYQILNIFNILYIEDDEMLLKNTVHILEDYFNNVFPALNTSDAKDILKTKKIDIIISDILLKDENGIDFIKKLKDNKDFDIPTILITAHSDSKYLLNAIKLKVDDYIIKPINFTLLLESLYKILYPLIQNKNLIKNNYIIKIISLISDTKQVDVVKYIINNLNDKNEFISSYQDIMNKIDISKPTLIKLFKLLIDKNILAKISHKTYKLKIK
jgi:DNA-binding NtrC family response regulator